MDAEAAEKHRAHPLRGDERHMGRDPCAHGIAHHVGPPDAEMIEKPAAILRHAVGIVGLRVVELLALPMAPVVEGDDPVSGARQGLHPKRVDPVDRMVRGEAVDEQDRIALPLMGRHVDIGDAHAVGIEIAHRTC